MLSLSKYEGRVAGMTRVHDQGEALMLSLSKHGAGRLGWPRVRPSC